MKQFDDIYRKKRVLVTGHTGFKGSWLTLWLLELGALVSGISLKPKENPNHWNLLDLNISDHFVDIRDLSLVKKVFEIQEPEIVFHLAAQPLVRQSYKDPIETLSTNVMGTANVLEACRTTESVQVVIIITTDKCYKNREWAWGYRENDALGGHDCYSASKACAELVTSSYSDAFFNFKESPLVATARTGNVIGGGDWSEDRLIPDLVRSLNNNISLEIRSPQATRPWQHVLDPLSGYLLLGQKLLMRDNSFTGPWNFGPAIEGNRTVTEILNKLNTYWEELRWHEIDKAQPHEANLLYLDSSQARSKLKWQPVWNHETVLQKTAEWYSAWMKNKNVVSHFQLSEYLINALELKHEWIK